MSCPHEAWEEFGGGHRVCADCRKVLPRLATPADTKGLTPEALAKLLADLGDAIIDRPSKCVPLIHAYAEAVAKSRVNAILDKLTNPEVVEVATTTLFARNCERIGHQDLPEPVWNRLPEESREEWRGDAMAALTAAAKKLRTP